VLVAPRGLDALAGEKTVHRVFVDTKDTTDAHRVEPALVDQAPNGLRMNTEPAGDLTDAVETVGLGFDGRHDSSAKAFNTPRSLMP
jgi:hypothetical protein